MNYLIAYIVGLVVFAAVDMTWLSLMVGRVYRPALGDLLAPNVNLPPAIAFYVLYPLGLLIFAVSPSLRAGTPAQAALYGALFGLFAYGTYDLTNHATLRGWPLQLTIVDMIWGGVLSALAAFAAAFAAHRLAG
jgi:uncharacterized membrane protein